MHEFRLFAEPHGRLLLAPLMIVPMMLEYVWARRRQIASHDLRESAASLTISLVGHLLRALESGLLALPLALVYRHRLFTFDQTCLPALFGLFLGIEFLLYWQHRAAHRINWFWASHSVHHSSRRFNLTAAIRLSWTSTLSGTFLFLLPLAWIGYGPLPIMAMLAFNLAYQFFIHTETIGRLGPFEWVFNTPAHHRVHHASNNACLDRNYGGVLILFDRLFGTFGAPPTDEPLRYGLVGGHHSVNPLRIAFSGWAALWLDIRNASGSAGKLGILAAPPGSTSRQNAKETL